MKAWAWALVLAAVFGAGWAVNGWRLGAAADRVRAEAAEEAQRRAEAHSAALAVLQADRDQLAELLADAGETGRLQLETAQHETNRLQRCLDNGTCGLRVNVVRDASCPGAVPPVPESGSVDSGAGAALAPDARRAYLALRSGIAVTEARLTACQAALRPLVR